VLHVRSEQRIPVLVDLASAPGRTVVFTRTKHGAKALSRQLNKNGVPAVELHGNLGQNARTRNMDAFHTGRASTLVATDIAARGIHVDDVGLVVHADPPTEHKAYLHRSGRTARAGNAGTVVTLACPDQVGDVRGLTRAAGIKPTTTRISGDSHPLLLELAPGERVLSGPVVIEPAASQQAAQQKAPSGNRSRSRRRKRGSGQGNGQQAASRGVSQESTRGGSRGSRPGQQGNRQNNHQNRPKTGSPARGRSGSAGGHSGGGHSAATFSAGRR
jgi:superfamily II DNA/RNA helicase